MEWKSLRGSFSQITKNINNNNNSSDKIIRPRVSSKMNKIWYTVVAVSVTSKQRNGYWKRQKKLEGDCLDMANFIVLGTEDWLVICSSLVILGQHIKKTDKCEITWILEPYFQPSWSLTSVGVENYVSLSTWTSFSTTTSPYGVMTSKLVLYSEIKTSPFIQRNLSIQLPLNRKTFLYFSPTIASRSTITFLNN